MADTLSIEALLDLWEQQESKPPPEEFVRQHGGRLSPEQAAALRRALDDLLHMEHALQTDAGLSTPGGEEKGEEAASRRGPMVLAPTCLRLTRLHARGGLGEVYVAADEGLGREVALKVIQSPRARMAASRHRFLREARLTARLQHPGIVPVYGTGEDSDGIPFYVMRFVSGQTLQEALEIHHRHSASKTEADTRLAFQDLLRCFVAVCNTVAYAHSRGVLHRDLKPSNILVGRFGETLVVDWGLARFAAGTADKSGGPSASCEGTSAAVTCEGAVLGTPAYMSPEQASGQVERLGPASDVYALGAVLYSLLTGHAPFEGVNTAEILQRVREGSFPSPCRVNRSVPRALEAICMQAMALRPEDRYPSAADLARDVERWLADEPVSAWPEPWYVRTRRWLSRHRTLTTSAAAALTVALVGLAVANLLLGRAWREADRQHQLAERRFGQARRAVDDFFTDVSEDPRLLANEPGMQKLRRTLLERAGRYYEEFLKEEAQSPSLQVETARAYYRLGKIEFEIHPGSKGLAKFRRACDLFEALAARNANPDLAQDLASTHANMAHLATVSGHFEEASAEYVKVRTIEERLVREHPENREYRAKLAKTYNNMGLMESTRSNVGGARTHYEKARRMGETLLREDPSSLTYAADLARTCKNLGVLASASGDFVAARKLYCQARDLQDKLVRDNPSAWGFLFGLAESHDEIATLDLGERKIEDALAASTQALKAWERLAGENPSVTGYAYNLARTYLLRSSILVVQGKTREALTLCDKARTIFERLQREDATLRGVVGEGLAPCYRQLGKLHLAEKRRDEALAFFEKARTGLEEVVREQPQVIDYAKNLVEVYLDLASWYGAAGRPQDALAFLEKARVLQGRLAFEHPDLPWHRWELAEVHRLLGGYHQQSKRGEEALAQYRTALRLYEQLPGAIRSRSVTARNVGATYLNVASLHLLRGELDEAAVAAERARTVREAICQNADASFSDRHDLGQTYGLLGLIREVQGKLEAAEGFFQKALTLLEALVRENQHHPAARVDLAGKQGCLGRIAQARGRNDLALDWFARALKTVEGLQPPPSLQERFGAVLFVAHLGELRGLRRLGRIEEALTLGEKLLAGWPDNPDFMYETACGLAASLSLPSIAPGQAGRHKRAEAAGRHAVELLTRADRAGYFTLRQHAEQLDCDPELEGLRSRPDFQKLLAHVRGQRTPKKQGP